VICDAEVLQPVSFNNEQQHLLLTSRFTDQLWIIVSLDEARAELNRMHPHKLQLPQKQHAITHATRR